MSEKQIQDIGIAILDLMQNDQVKHLNPSSMYFDKDNYKLCKVIAGDKRIFHQFDLAKTTKGDFGSLNYTRDQLRFLTPSGVSTS